LPTPDGITSEDWDAVHALAVDLFNASKDEEPVLRSRLLRCLDALEARYGPLPSILATRADFLDADHPARKELLLRAHTAAESTGDQLNLLETAHSLAELCLERSDVNEARRWLETMKRYLDERPDSYLATEYEQLTARYRRLAIRRAEP
jgi:hypothetical protein